jgi:hypothetical protein
MKSVRFAQNSSTPQKPSEANLARYLESKTYAPQGAGLPQSRQGAIPQKPAVFTPRHFEYLDECGAADYLKSSRRRLKELRLRGGGPPFVRLGAAVRYRTDWLDAWAVQNAVSSTSEEAARRRDED